MIVLIPIQKICRSLVPEDYARVTFYAGRIRRIDATRRGLCVQGQRLVVDSHTLASFASDDGPIVTRLIYLRTSLYDFHGPAFAPRLVMGSALRSLYIFHGSSEYDAQHPLSFPLLWSNVAHLLSYASDLFLLVFEEDIADDPHISYDGVNMLCASYRSLPNLRQLDARPSPFDIDTLAHFSTSPTLKRLDTAVPSHVLRQFTLSSPIIPVYDRLKHLCIETEQLSSVPGFLGCDGFRCLKRLELSRCKPEIAWDLPSFFSPALSSSIPLKRLILVDTILDPPFPPQSVSLRGLSLPLPFRNLMELSVDFEGSLDLDDRSLGAMAEAWPLLHKLQLCDWSNPCDRPTQVTLVGLLSLTRCQSLKDLVLRVNALQIDQQTMHSAIVTPARALTDFCICRSLGLRPTAITQVLQMAFPNLRNLSYGHSREHNLFGALTDLSPVETLYFECWQDVWRQLNNNIWS
jgi:hypothetical protein